MTTEISARESLEQLIAAHQTDYAALSRMLGRNAAYIQQYLKRGTPRRLPEEERRALARFFGVEEHILGGPEHGPAAFGIHLIPRLNVSASAGPGMLDQSDSLAGKVGFDQQWLKQLSNNPEKLTMIRVSGDSMLPTLSDGEDIMVDTSPIRLPLRAGIYVLRYDDSLMVKRVLPCGQGLIDIRSDNPQSQSWEAVSVDDAHLIGKVVWAGRRLS